MSRKVMMGSWRWVVAAGSLLLAICLSQPAAGWPNNGLPMVPQEATNSIDYLNLMGYEGIPVFGDTDLLHGPPPPIADWVTTHCRFVDSLGHNLQDNFLRYPVHLPDGAKISYIQLRVADFAVTGQLWAYFRSRPWNSRAIGDTHNLVVTSPAIQADQVLNMFNVNREVDNTNRSYWIDVATAAADAAGELCVYSVHVVYIPRLFADGFESGNTGDWSTAIP